MAGGVPAGMEEMERRIGVLVAGGVPAGRKEMGRRSSDGYRERRG